ncbi:MAG: hypothetical protein FJ152_01120 [Firmicutes bacterium]|nr:hypothetical protein [Bacillota bacterium]
MYIHTGNSRIIFKRELIGIFNYDLFDSDQLDNNEKIWQQNVNELKAKKGRSQSIVVTDRELFSAPISPLTLAGRSNK